jgi:hypothetical protein
MEKEILIVSKVDTIERTIQTLYYFDESKYDIGYELLQTLNQQLKDDGEYPRVYFTTSFAKGN